MVVQSVNIAVHSGKMGVSGLLTFLREGRNALSSTQVLTSTLRATSGNLDDADDGTPVYAVDDSQPREELPLVIDGWAFIWSLYNDNLPWATGGEYHAFALLIERVILAWDKLGIRPYFVFDGPTPSNKHNLVISRYASALRTSQLFHLTSPISRSAPRFLNSSIILPPLIYTCTLTTLQDLGLQPGVQIFVLPEGEADGYCVSLASELGGWVVSNDTDEVILGAGAGGEGYKGFVPIEMMQWTMEEVVDEGVKNGNGMEEQPTGTENLDDGFAPVASSRRKKRSAPPVSPHTPTTGPRTFAQHLLPPDIPPPTSSSPPLKLALILTSFHPSDLARRLRIPPTHLPLLASLVGTDHSPPSAPNLFFDQRSARAERIELVARVIRECLDPKSAAQKKGRWKKGSNGLSVPSKGKGSVIPSWDDTASMAGSVTSSPREEPPVTAGDHAYEFIRLVVLNLLLRPLLNEDTLDRLVTGMIDATCHYILPVSPSTLALYAGPPEPEENVDIAMSVASIRMPVTGSCCVTHPYCDCSDPAGGVAIWICPCYNSELDASPSGLSCSPDRHDRLRARYALARNAGYMSLFSAFSEPDRSYMHSMLEHPDGNPLRMSEGSRRMRRIAWEIVARGMGLFGSRGDCEEASAGNSEDESSNRVGPDLDMESTDVEGSVMDATDVSALDAGNPHVVWEYMRAGSSVKLDAFPLQLDLASGIDTPVALLEWSQQERWGILRQLCDSDTPAVAALPSELQLLVIVLRISIVRAADASKTKSTAKYWTHDKLVRSLMAGLASLQLWTPDRSGSSRLADSTIDDPLILESPASLIISQVAAASFDVLHLGQALLLCESDTGGGVPDRDCFRPYASQEGTIWHRTFSASDVTAPGGEGDSLLSACYVAVSEEMQEKILGWRQIAVPNVHPSLSLTCLTLPTTQEAPPNLEALLSLLSPADLARHNRYHHLADRLRFLSGRLLLRRAVRRSANGQEPSDVRANVKDAKPDIGSGPLELGSGTKGKPYLKHPLQPSLLDFNISHDTYFAVLATLSYTDGTTELHAPFPAVAAPDITNYTNDVQGCVGVDIMRLDRTTDEGRDLEEALIDQLTTAEIAALPPRSLDNPSSESPLPTPNAKVDHLLTLWTIKEAYVKAIGVGLSMDLRRVEVVISHATRGEGRCDLCSGALQIKVDGADLGVSSGWHTSRDELRHQPENVRENLDGNLRGIRATAETERYSWAVVWQLPGGTKRSGGAQKCVRPAMEVDSWTLVANELKQRRKVIKDKRAPPSPIKTRPKPSGAASGGSKGKFDLLAGL